MTNDERVQTKENYSRTCTLHTEYVDTMAFRLEEADHDFLWRKGYLTTKLWLEKRSEKNKEKRKKVASSIAKSLMARAKSEKALTPTPVADVVCAPPAMAPEADAAQLRAMLPKIQAALSSRTMNDAEKLAVIQRLADKASAQ